MNPPQQYRQHIRMLEQHQINAEKHALELSKMLSQVNRNLSTEEAKLFEAKTLQEQAKKELEALREQTQKYQAKLEQLYKQHEQHAKATRTEASKEANDTTEDASQDTNAASAGSDILTMLTAYQRGGFFTTSDVDVYKMHIDVLEQLFTEGTQANTGTTNHGNTFMDTSTTTDRREVSNGSSKFNPHVPLCPYELNGECEDDKCPYQHWNRSTTISDTKSSPRVIASKEGGELQLTERENIDGSIPRGLRRKMVETAKATYARKRMRGMQGPYLGTAHLDRVLADHSEQRRWIHSLLSSVGSVVCQDCKTSENWGNTTLIRLQKYRQSGKTISDALVCLKTFLDGESESHLQQSVENLPAWIFLMNFLSITVPHPTKLSALSALCGGTRNFYPRSCIAHVMCAFVEQRYSLECWDALVNQPYTHSNSVDVKFALFVLRTHVLVERGFTKRAIDLLCQALGRKDSFCTVETQEKDVLGPADIAPVYRPLLWGTLLFLLCTGECLGLRLMFKPTSALVLPADTSRVKNSLYSIMTGGGRFSTNFFDLVACACRQIGLSCTFSGDSASVKSVTVAAAPTASQHSDNGAPVPPVTVDAAGQCICYILLALLDTFDCLEQNINAVRQVCDPSRAPHVYFRRALLALLPRPFDVELIDAVLLLPGLEAGILSLEDVSKRSAAVINEAVAQASGNEDTDSVVVRYPHVFRAWHDDWKQHCELEMTHLQLLQFGDRLRALASTLSATEFFYVLYLSVYDFVSGLKANTNLDRLHEVVFQAVELSVGMDRVEGVESVVLGPLNHALCPDACQHFLVQYLCLLEKFGLLTPSSVMSVMDLAFQKSQCVCIVFEWYVQWRKRNGVRDCLSMQLFSAQKGLNVSELPLVTVAAAAKATILDNEFDTPFLWECIETLLQAQTAAGFEKVLQLCHELALPSSLLNISTRLGSCVSLWDPVEPLSVEPSVCRKILRAGGVTSGQTQNKLVLRGAFNTGQPRSALPASLFHLCTLEELSLSNNALPSLPPCLTNLKSLSILDVSHNEMACVPSAVWSLPSLKSLNASYNIIVSLGDDISKCTTLRILQLAHNRLPSIPLALLNLKELRELDVSFNQVRTIPAGFAENLALTTFKANGNPVEGWVSKAVLL